MYDFKKKYLNAVNVNEFFTVNQLSVFFHKRADDSATFLKRFHLYRSWNSTSNVALSHNQRYKINTRGFQTFTETYFSLVSNSISTIKNNFKHPD